MNKIKTKFLPVVLLIFTLAQIAGAQTNSYTYQGRLTDNNATANGVYDLQFALYDAETGGSQIGATQTTASVTVAGGVFTVRLDFAAPNAFDGNARYLEIAVKSATDTDYTTLTPRQSITSTPYAIRSKNSATSDISTDTLNVDGTPADEIIKEGDARLTDERMPTSGSADYVQNRATEQALTDFNISGNGTADVFNARTQFNIGGSRVLTALGSNLSIGLESGAISSETGISNIFVGPRTGTRNTTGNSNLFFGQDAGASNTSGSYNLFFGISTGLNSTGSYNSFFGGGAGFYNLTGSYNTFIGYVAGAAPLNNGNRNTLLGAETLLGSGTLEYATAIGAGATVAASNTIVLGRQLDTVQIPGTLSINNFSANIINAATQFNIGGERILTASNFTTFVGFRTGTGGQINAFFGNDAGRFTTGSGNSFFGSGAGESNLTGSENSFFGRLAGVSNTSGFENSMFGLQAGYENTTGSNNSFFGNFSGNSNIAGSYNTIIGSAANVGADNLNYATALGSGAVVSTSNTIVLGRANGNDKIRIFGLGADGSTALCRNADNEISTCAPINLTEEKRDNIEQINTLREQINEQQITIDALKKLVCASNPAAAVCQ